MNKAINLAGLPNSFIQLLLNQLNSAVIHLPARAPGRLFLEKGGEGALFLCSAVEHPKPIPFQLQSCFLSFLLRQRARLRLFWTTVSYPLAGTGHWFQDRNLRCSGFLFNENLCCQCFVRGDATRSHLLLSFQQEPLLPPCATRRSHWLGGVGRCHHLPQGRTECQAGPIGTGAVGWPQPLKSLWQQCQGEPDRLEAAKDRTW